MNVGAELRRARRRARLTQTELADRAATSQATVSAYESGRKQPTVDTFGRLLAASGARLAVEPSRRTVRRPSAPEVAKAGRTLAEVIELAEALPRRRGQRLRYPRLGSPGRRAA